MSKNSVALFCENSKKSKKGKTLLPEFWDEKRFSSKKSWSGFNFANAFSLCWGSSIVWRLLMVCCIPFSIAMEGNESEIRKTKKSSNHTTSHVIVQLKSTEISKL